MGSNRGDDFGAEADCLGHATAQATTVAGLHVRALILADGLIDEKDEDYTTDKLMIWSIVRDLIKMNS